MTSRRVAGAAACALGLGSCSAASTVGIEPGPAVTGALADDLVALGPPDAAYEPACVVRGAIRDCFWVTTTGVIVRRADAGAGWRPPASRASTARSPVAVVAPTGTTLVLTYLDAAGNLLEHVVGAAGWSGAPVVIGRPPGATLVDAPACTTRFLAGPARLATGMTAIDCFARTAGGELAAITKRDGTWGEWSVIAGARPRSAPSALSLGAGSDEVFFRGDDDALVQVSRVGGTWRAPTVLGGALASAPVCDRTGPDRIDCVARGARPGEPAACAWQDGVGWRVRPQRGAPARRPARPCDGAP